MPPTNSYTTVQSHNHSHNSPARSLQRTISMASTLEAANRDRTSVIVRPRRPTEEKSLSVQPNPTHPMDGPKPCPSLMWTLCPKRSYIQWRNKVGAGPCAMISKGPYSPHRVLPSPPAFPQRWTRVHCTSCTQ